MNIANPLADCLKNIRVAIYMIKNNYPGFYVVFNRKIILGKCISKTHSKSINTF